MSHPHIYTEKQLLLRIAEGDEVAFARLYELLLPSLHAFIFKMVKTEDGVQEVIQEAFIRIWMNRDQLPDIEYPKAWASKVALNECYKFLRTHRKELRNKALRTSEEALDGNDGVNRLSLAETKTLISQAIAELPERRRLIYQMSRNEEMKIPEIAKILNLSPGYVKKALILALRQMRQYLSARDKILLILLIRVHFNFF